jgi:hypothetical protein
MNTLATPGQVVTEVGLANAGAHPLTLFKEKKIEWQNYTLFLVSYCGGNFMDRSLYVKTPLVFGTLASWFASEDLPERFKTQTDYDGLMREFIASLIDLLVHENLTVRETAKEALGPESQLQLFSMIVLQLDRFVQRNILCSSADFFVSVFLLDCLSDGYRIGTPQTRRFWRIK